MRVLHSTPLGTWLCLGFALLVAPHAAGAARTLDWQRVEGASAVVRVDRISALALERASGRVALGDERGVAVGQPGRVFRRVARTAAVRDLLFLPSSIESGALLAATADGLVRVSPDGRTETRSPGPGAAARDALRIASAPGALAVATAAGVFVSHDARRWQRLRSLAAGPASAVALRAREGVTELWAVVAGELWRTRLETGASAPVGRDGARVTVASAGDDAPVDIRFEVGGAEVVVVFPRALAVRAGADGWRVLRPGLPPGARARRLHAGADRLWLATDRGLLEAESLGGPWRRARSPLGSAPVQAFDGDLLEVYVATPDGLRAGRVTAPGAASRARAEFPDDPSIRVVYQAALAYLRLQPRRSDALRRGVERRGWLPVVDLTFGAGQDDSRRTDRDQSFVSGDTRDLLDRERDRSTDFDVALRFSWDLGDVAYHPEQIDVSRETRELIELRDDVLDEIAQLYFERRRVLGELAARGPGDDGEALRLRLRAAELAAGIDAWTGGWFSRHAAAP